MAQISLRSCSTKLNVGYLVLRPVLNSGHKSLFPMVTIIQALHCTTNRKYLHYIAYDRDIKVHLYMRFMIFIHSAHQSPNFISISCLRLSLLGSRSNVSNNISILCKSFDMTRSNIGTCTPVYRNVNDMLVDEETKTITNVIKRLLYIKDCLRVSTDRFVLNMSEIDQIITQLCPE